MSNVPSLKKIKKIPILVYFIMFLYFLIAIGNCYQKIGTTVNIDATLKYGGEKTFAKVIVKGNSFITGTDGTLYLQVKDFKEAILLNIANANELIRFYDLFFMLILNTVVFITVYLMKEDTIFSNTTIKGLQIVVYLIIISPLLDFGYSLISKRIIEHLTNNQLTTPLHSFGYLRLLLSLFLAPLIPLLINKGKSLQQNQDLTI